MRLITALPLLAGLMLSTNLMAADATTATKTPSPAQAAQQKRMTDCNQQASTKSLKGADRSTFASTCLKSEGSAATGKTPDAAAAENEELQRRRQAPRI